MLREQTLRQLSYYLDGVGEVDIQQADDQLERYHHNLRARIRIVQNEIYVINWVERNARRRVLPMVAFLFQVLACQYQLPDVELVVFWADGGVSNQHGSQRSPPIFNWSRNESEPLTQHDLLVPVHPAEARVRREIHALADARSQVPWHHKQAKAVWRGSTTGGRLTAADSWGLLPRGRVVLACRNATHLCDAGFTSAVQTAGASDEEKERLRQAVWKNITAAGASRQGMTLLEQARKYKYILLLDGNAPACTRSIQLLLSGSVVIKLASGGVEWYYSQLVPWHHYVPVDTPEDIVPTIQWLKQHDEEAQQIAANARSFALQHLLAKPAGCYMLDMLHGYASLLTFRPKAPDPKDTSSKRLRDLLPDSEVLMLHAFLNGTDAFCPGLFGDLM